MKSWRNVSSQSVMILLLTTALFATAARLRAQSTSDQIYRIVIIDNKTETEARKFKELLESWGYVPINLDEIDGKFRVLYGNFRTNAAAAAALEQLENDGIYTKDIVPMGRPAAEPTTAEVNYIVRVAEFTHEGEARVLCDQLRPKYPTVQTRLYEGFYQVIILSPTMRDAQMTLGQVRQQNFRTAKVDLLRPGTAPLPVPVLDEPSSQPTSTPAVEIPKSIQESDIWNRMTIEQRNEVLKSVAIQRAIGEGQPWAEQILDINKRLKGLDENVKNLSEKIVSEQEAEAKKRQAIAELFQHSDNMFKAGKLPEAIEDLTKVLEIEPDNQNALRRREHLEAKMHGDPFPGATDERERQFQELKATAEQLEKSNTKKELEHAKYIWFDIKNLDKVKYGSTADSKINDLNRRISSIEEQERTVESQAKRSILFVICGLAGALVLAFGMIAMTWWRSKKRHTELMMKVQEITSIRPMRELDGGPRPALAGAGSATESDIFAPILPGGQPGDPLGGVSDVEAKPGKPAKPAKEDKKKKKGKDKEEPVAEEKPAASPFGDDIFGDMSGGGSTSVAPAMAAGDMNFDDIFGNTETPAPEPVKTAPAEPEAMESINLGGGEDVFSNLFGDDTNAPTASSAPTVKSPAVPEAKPEPGPISFGDILSAGDTQEPETAKAESAEDLLSLFDSNIPSVTDDQPAPRASVDERLQDSPFASLFDGETNADTSPKPVPVGRAVEDDTEIPAIKLDMPGGATRGSSTGGDGFNGDGGNSGSPEFSQTNTSVEMPAFNFDELLTAESPEPEGDGTVQLDFENDPVDRKPESWEGDYAYATLAVRGDTPPRGSQQYLCFEKKEGTGKAHYSYHFADMTGVVGIEFDLRCNDKNKFLLGFYVEKDGDFQQSVHTKILRSEAQTTPTIHMQGESAPYLLGSWAHIKYVVDLNKGIVNGYIDSTHVARNLPLQPNPGALNTLSIRDNINTTGTLLLDNIQIYKIS